MYLSFVFFAFSILIPYSSPQKEKERRLIIISKEQDEPAFEERRLALVVGNNDNKVGLLINPVNGAYDIAEILKERDITVTMKFNIDHPIM